MRFLSPRLGKPAGRVEAAVHYGIGTIGRRLYLYWAVAAFLDAGAMLELIDSGTVTPALVPVGNVRAGDVSVPYYADDRPVDVLRRLKAAGARNVHLDGDGNVAQTIQQGSRSTT